MTITMPESVELPQEGLLGQLGMGLGSGIQTGTAEILKSFLQMKQKEMESQGLMQAMGLGGPDAAHAGQQPQMGMEGQEQGSMQPQQPVDPRERIRQIATNPQAMMALTARNPQAANTILKMNDSILAQEKEGLKALKETKEKKSLLTAWDQMMDLAETGAVGTATLPMRGSEKTAAAWAKLKTLNTVFEGKLIKELNRGSLSEGHYKRIVAKLPKPWDRVATIKAKLNALAGIFDLDRGTMKTTEPEIKEPSEKMFENIPKATSVPAGKKVRDNKTGKIYQTDGSTWREVS